MNSSLLWACLIAFGPAVAILLVAWMPRPWRFPRRRTAYHWSTAPTVETRSPAYSLPGDDAVLAAGQVALSEHEITTIAELSAVISREY